jgi:biopolymer transport protein ExbD
MAASPGNEEGDLGFQIAPMVDVVFVLLLFFMAAASMKGFEKELSVRIPTLPGKPDDTVVTIEISPAGRVVVNDQLFGKPGDHELLALKRWLREAREEFGNTDSIVLSPDDDTRHERVMEVLGACRGAGVTKLAFR